MDSMSYRNSRPPQRASTPDSRDEPHNHAKEEKVAEHNSQPSSARRSTHAPAQHPRKKKPLVLIAAAIILVAMAAAAVFFMNQRESSGAIGIDSNKYQAVFFTNGQVYFGKLTEQNEDFLRLTDIYYLQAQSEAGGESDNPQNAANNQQGDVQLIKLGDEVHGPDDEMMINRDQVLFYENLKADGKVSQSISQYKQR